MSFLGKVIPIANTQAWTPPVSNQVIGGWASCEGQLFSSIGTPGVDYDSSFTGNVPQISDSRFIVGHTVLGVSGGSDSVTLSSLNMPQLTSGNENTSHFHSYSGFSGASTTGHTHTMGSGENSVTHVHYFSRVKVADIGGTGNTLIDWNGTASYTTAAETANHTHILWGSGYIDTDHVHYISIVTGLVSSKHTHKIGSSSANPTNNVPLYFSSKYVIAVGEIDSIPLGAVVPIGNAQAWSLPSSGQVKDGWALCNGQTFASLGVGNYDSSFTGNLPQLSDSRFVMGHTTPANTGGANSLMLTWDQIPEITSGDNNSDHGHNGSRQTQTVNMNHYHGGQTGGRSAAHTHGYSAQTAVDGLNNMYYLGSALTVGSITSSEGGAHTHSVSFAASDGVNSHAHLTTSYSIGYNNVKHSHSFGFGLGAQTPVNKTPLYFTCVYVMKVSN